MIFEIRTYLLKPGTAPQAEEAFAVASKRAPSSRAIAGFWRTEVGTLNQIIHIWPYKDLTSATASAPKRSRPRSGRPRSPTSSSTWNPRSSFRRPSRPISSRASTAASTSSAPTPTGRAPSPRSSRPGPRASRSAAAVSPLIFAGYTDIGALNQWVHVWAYKNMGEREHLRASAMKPGQWPPPRGEGVVLHKQRAPSPSRRSSRRLR